MLSGGTFPVLSKQKKGIYMSEKYKDTGLRPEERAKLLLEEMGLEEKMGQVNCVFPFDRVCFDYDYISEQTKYGIGEVSTLEMRRMETLEEAAAWQRKVQEIVMANSEHHIPAIFHMEGKLRKLSAVRRRPAALPMYWRRFWIFPGIPAWGGRGKPMVRIRCWLPLWERLIQEASKREKLQEEGQRVWQSIFWLFIIRRAVSMGQTA